VLCHSFVIRISAFVISRQWPPHSDFGIRHFAAMAASSFRFAATSSNNSSITFRIFGSASGSRHAVRARQAV
jgi:hypothetical protein